MVLEKLKKIAQKTPLPKKDNLVVALDVGTEYVKALIGKVEGENISIVGVGRTRQALSDMQSGAIADISAVVANCDQALSDAEQMAGVSARACVVGIAGELVKGTTATIRFRRRNATEAIDMQEMERIIKLIQSKAFDVAKQQLGWEVGNKDIEVRLVNSAIVSMAIDGQRITNPIGFQGKDLAIQLYTAFAPLVHIGALEQVAHELELDLLAVAAEPFAVARSVIGNDATSNLSAILIDVGGGTTDIAVVNEGGVEGTKMFGIGGRSYTRGISQELGIDFETAEKLKLALTNAELSEKKRATIEAPLTKTLEVWLSGVELALSEFNNLEHLPRRILLCGGGASLDMLVDALEHGSWYKSLPFTRRPIIQHIKPNQVVGIVDKSDSIHDHTFITAMGLLRVGIDTVGEIDSEDRSIKQQLDKLLRI